MKSRITDRIFATTSLAAQDRLVMTDDCESLEEAFSMAVWDPKSLKLDRLDDGTSDIDTLDAFEYSWERDIGKIYQKIGGDDLIADIIRRVVEKCFLNRI